MAIKDTGIAAKAKETPAKSAEVLLREAKQAQKFKEISKDDNASTTGRLVNPPAAVIPNPNGAGGEAGATGFFGANLLGGANIQTSRTNVYGRPQPQPSEFVNPFSSNYIAQTYASPTIRAGGALSADKQGNVTPQRTEIGGDKQSEVGRTIPINSIGGDKQSQLASPATTSTAPTAPSTEITRENYSQWVDYWNWQARNPSAARAQITADAIAKGKPDPFAPVVMTREQIWQMKAEQRRKGMWKSAGDDISTGGYSRPTYSPTPYMGTGNYYSTIINTGSG